MAGSTANYEPGVPTRRFTLYRVAADILLAGLCGLPSLIMLLFITPHKRGYYCNDESLLKPHVKGSIPTALMATIGFVIAILVITYCEVMRTVFWESPNRETPVPYRVVAYYIGNKSVHRVFVRLYKYIGYFILGAAFSMMIVDIAKYSSGRLRPSFFEVCAPVPIGAPNCSVTDLNRYIAEYQCTHTATDGSPYTAHDLKEVHLSFYSGHSSFAFYTAVYLMLYLQARVRPCGIFLSPVLVPIAQWILVVLATFSAILNEIEFSHHWSDVGVGVIMGSLIALIMSLFVVKVFNYKKFERRISRQQEPV